MRVRIGRQVRARARARGIKLKSAGRASARLIAGIHFAGPKCYVASSRAADGGHSTKTRGGMPAFITVVAHCTPCNGQAWPCGDRFRVCRNNWSLGHTHSLPVSLDFQPAFPPLATLILSGSGGEIFILARIYIGLHRRKIGAHEPVIVQSQPTRFRPSTRGVGWRGAAGRARRKISPPCLCRRVICLK